MRLLRVKESANLLGLKAASIRQLEKHGLLKSIRDWSGHRRFRESDVLKFKKELLGSRGDRDEERCLVTNRRK